MNTTLYVFFSTLGNYHFIKQVAYFLSYPVGYIFPIVIAIYLAKKDKRPMHAFSLLFLSMFVTWLLTAGLKLLFHIQRPFIGFTYFDTGDYSFPSLHAAVFMALAVAVVHVKPKWTYGILALAFLVGVSRIVLGVHTPIDIVGGFIVGGAVSYSLVRQFKKI